MLESYNTLQSIAVGEREFAILISTIAPQDERYIVCELISDEVSDRYTDIVYCGDYMEAIDEYSSRMSAAVQAFRASQEQARKVVGRNSEIKAGPPIIPIEREDDLHGKVLVLDGAACNPGCQYATYQIMLCVGGTGAAANTRFGVCSCRRLYDGSIHLKTRDEFLGILPNENLPAWAKKKMRRLTE